MGKILKRVFIVVGVIILVLVVLFFAMCSVMNYRNKNYWKYADPYGEIEKKFTPLGKYDVSCDEIDAKDGLCKKYSVWYPSDIKNSTEKFPVVIMANGTGSKASGYKEVFKHLASWGFIVAGNEDENCRTGASSAATLDYVLALNENDDSKFYGKIDVEHIGITGHSQGGVGALNAVLEQPNGNRYSAVFTASQTGVFWKTDKNYGSEWGYDLTKLNIPCMMVAGTGAFDAGEATDITATSGQGICPLYSMLECFDTIPNGVTKVIARATGKDHGDMLRFPDGYMTAWFMYHLKGETTADFFGGDNAEILSNKNWQDVKVNAG